MNSKQTWEDLANILRLYFWQILWRRGKPTFPKLVGFPWILQKWCVLIFAPSKSHSVTCQIFQSFLAPLIHEETAHCNKDDTIGWKRRLIQLHLQEFWSSFVRFKNGNFCVIFTTFDEWWKVLLATGATGAWQIFWNTCTTLYHLHITTLYHLLSALYHLCIQLKNVTGKTLQECKTVLTSH